MTAYGNFSKVYDVLMAETPYSRWMDNIEALWKRHGLKPKLVADLGCGTGTVAIGLAGRGYDMTGIDASIEMLREAREKDEKGAVLFLNQDMRELDLYGTMDSIISTCDAMNYLESGEDLLQVFKLVNNFLDPRGLFIFDMNTEYKFRHVLADNTFAAADEDSAFIWENTYYEEEGINEYRVTLFIAEGEGGNGCYTRHMETHYEYAYDLETVAELLEEAGMVLEGVYDADTLDEPVATSERIYFTAREKGKERQA